MAVPRSNTRISQIRRGTSNQACNSNRISGDASIGRILQSAVVSAQVMQPKRPIIRTVIAIGFALSISVAARAQQRPLLTEDVDIIPPGTLRIQAGIDFMQNARYP